jgi:hypothetical protein
VADEEKYSVGCGNAMSAGVWCGCRSKEAYRKALRVIVLCSVVLSVLHLHHRKRLETKHLVHQPKRLRREELKKTEGANSHVSVGVVGVASEEPEGKERNDGIYGIRILQNQGRLIRISDSCRRDEDMGRTSVAVLHAWYSC